MRCADPFLACSVRPRRVWPEGARLLAACHPIVVTDARGRRLCNLLGATAITVWIEGAARGLRRVLAGIDPFAPAAAAGGVLAVARQLGDVTGAELFAVHAWEAPGEQLLARHVAQRCAWRYAATQRATAQRLFDEHLHRARCELAPDHRICERGEAAHVLQRLVGDLDIDVVVLGTTPRSRVARALLGCTAVRVADTVSCHVVVSPPAEAVTRCTSLPRAVARRRGA